ncbi:hypothetical protein ABFX02_13G005600 [Erythranthe guttata]
MVLNKIFGNKNSTNNLSDMNPFRASRAPTTASDAVERKSRALKIVHAGGHAERYYMAIPASTIIEKYPSFILARPEIFLRPWESVVRPDEMLVPGQKYYVVPRRTVRKLRRRIKKITSIVMDPFESKSSISGILIKPGPKVKTRDLHVRFFGIESTNQKPSSGSLEVSCDKKSGNNGRGSKENPNQMDEKNRRARNANLWEPSFNSINE